MNNSHPFCIPKESVKNPIKPYSGIKAKQIRLYLITRVGPKLYFRAKRSHTTLPIAASVVRAATQWQERGSRKARCRGGGGRERLLAGRTCSDGHLEEDHADPDGLVHAPPVQLGRCKEAAQRGDEREAVRVEEPADEQGHQLLELANLADGAPDWRGRVKRLDREKMRGGGGGEATDPFAIRTRCSSRPQEAAGGRGA